MIFNIGMNAIGVSLVFPDIAHKPGAEEATENIIQYQCFLKIRVLPVIKSSCQTNRSLYTIRIIILTDLPFI